VAAAAAPRYGFNRPPHAATENAQALAHILDYRHASVYLPHRNRLKLQALIGSATPASPVRPW
jgi:hypothetical protein